MAKAIFCARHERRHDVPERVEPGADVRDGNAYIRPGGHGDEKLVLAIFARSPVVHHVFHASSACTHQLLSDRLLLPLRAESGE